MWVLPCTPSQHQRIYNMWVLPCTPSHLSLAIFSKRFEVMARLVGQFNALRKKVTFQ